MAHFVLMFRGGPPRPADLELIEQAADVTILDHSEARVLLIDAPDRAAELLRDQLGDWLVAEEVAYDPPGPATQTVRDDLPQGPE